MTRYTLGIDTGGTYTDAVIIDVVKHQVVATAKALTSRADLSIGVSEALTRVLDMAGDTFDTAEISCVSLSTTLATNALVQGHGDDVMTFLVGFDDGMVERTLIAEAAPSTTIVRIRGGHTYSGEEAEPLDVAAVNAALSEHGGRVRGYAVASQYSVRNSGHELQLKDIIEAATSHPVTISSDLSAALDAPCRALTATFNARIISQISALENAVQSSMRRLGIAAPLLIVKGDGSLAPAEAVVKKPIETILSGPAASVIGARFLCGLADFVIADIGGTTSDVATVRNGWPSLNESGSDVGGFRTLVRAIDMRTIGLGGDSEVLVDFRGVVSLDNNRVVPISLLGHRWPRVVSELESALSADSGMLGSLRYGVTPDGGQELAINEAASEKDRLFLAQFQSGEPVLLRDAVSGAADIARVSRLVAQGLLQVSGFTPSDAAHVLGLQSQWSASAAMAACELLGRASGMVKGGEVGPQLKELAQTVSGELARKSSWLLLEQLAGLEFEANNVLVDAVTRGSSGLHNLGTEFRPLLPVVAVGGPAAIFFPEVGRRLNTEVIIPEHSAVANAIGAAVGLIKVCVTVEITRNDSGFLVHHGEAPEFVAGSMAALEQAKAVAHEEALRRARSLGGHDMKIDLSVSRIDVPDMDESVSLVAATITAEAVGEFAPRDA
jgi:N-methylhydantoinase A/oxoprolinase/acetone carboxylase beta subunit